MQTGNHASHPEIWFRASPHVSFADLEERIRTGTLTASLRLGRRDSSHAKGYAPGQKVTLRLFDNNGHESLLHQIQVLEVETKPLDSLTHEDFEALQVYHSVSEVRSDLSFFEKQLIAPQEEVSLVTFRYLSP